MTVGSEDGVGDGDTVGVGVGDGDTAGDGVGDGDTVGVGVGVGVGDGVGIKPFTIRKSPAFPSASI